LQSPYKRTFFGGGAESTDYLENGGDKYLTMRAQPRKGPDLQLGGRVQNTSVGFNKQKLAQILGTYCEKKKGDLQKEQNPREL